MVLDQREDCTAGWLQEAPSGKGLAHQAQVSKGSPIQSQLSEGTLAQPPISKDIEASADTTISQLGGPHLSGVSEAQTPTHSISTGSPLPDAGGTHGQTPPRQTGLKGVLGEACFNIIPQHQARRTPTSRHAVAVWPPVQFASHQPAFAPPNSAFQLHEQPQQAAPTLASPQHEHEDQQSPSAALFDTQPETDVMLQRHHGEAECPHETQSWFQYLNAEHEPEQVSQCS